MVFYLSVDGHMKLVVAIPASLMAAKPPVISTKLWMPLLFNIEAAIMLL